MQSLGYLEVDAAAQHREVVQVEPHGQDRIGHSGPSGSLENSGGAAGNTHQNQEESILGAILTT